MRDIKIVPQSKKSSDPAIKLFGKFQDYLDIFSNIDSDLLPEYQLYDHLITLIEGKMLMWGPLYLMSVDKLKVLKVHIEK